MLQGWIKLHRQILSSNIFQNERLLKIWIWCLAKATHKSRKQIVGRQKIKLEKGQFITGRNAAAAELAMAPSTAWDYMKLLESEECISIESNNKFSIVTIVNWEIYQAKEEGSNKEVGEQEEKEKDKKEDKIPYKEIVDFLNKEAGKNYQHTTKKTRALIKTRYNEGFKLEDFKRVISIKVPEWKGTEMEKFLRPNTLFATNFESYLNQPMPHSEGDHGGVGATQGWNNKL